MLCTGATLHYTYCTFSSRRLAAHLTCGCLPCAVVHCIACLVQLCICTAKEQTTHAGTSIHLRTAMPALSALHCSVPLLSVSGMMLPAAAAGSDLRILRRAMPSVLSCRVRPIGCPLLLLVPGRAACFLTRSPLSSRRSPRHEPASVLHGQGTERHDSLLRRSEICSRYPARAVLSSQPLFFAPSSLRWRV